MLNLLMRSEAELLLMALEYAGIPNIAIAINKFKELRKEQDKLDEESMNRLIKALSKESITANT